MEVSLSLLITNSGAALFKHKQANDKVTAVLLMLLAELLRPRFSFLIFKNERKASFEYLLCPPSAAAPLSKRQNVS